MRRALSVPIVGAAMAILIGTVTNPGGRPSTGSITSGITDIRFAGEGPNGIEPSLDSFASRTASRLDRNRIGAGNVHADLEAFRDDALLAQTAFVDISPDESDLINEMDLNGTCPAPCPSGGSGGRVNGLASVPGDPNTYYAASELGGLFKTTNGGDSWFPLDGHLPTRTWDVAAAADGLTVYATSFYDGRENSLAGIQVSKNAGSTWTHPAITSPAGCDSVRASQASAFGISLRPGTNEAQIGTNCGIARTTNGGTDWVQFDPTPTTTSDSIWDLVALPSGQTYACGDEGLLFSPDGAPPVGSLTNWKVLGFPPAALSNPALPMNEPLFGFCSLAVSPDESNVVFVVFDGIGFGEFFATRNGGRFFEGVVAFSGGTATGVTWSAIPHPDGSNPKKRVPFLVTNDRSGSAFDLWLGAGDFWRAPCTAGSTPRCSTDMSNWSGPFTALQPDPDRVHGDSGDVEFDPTVVVDACPTMYSSDGGIYRREAQVTNMTSPDCHSDPDEFEAANVGVHAQLLWGMAGVHRAGDPAEDVYIALQDNGAFGTLDAGQTKPSWTQVAGADVFDVVADPTRVVAAQDAVWAGGPLFSNMAKVIPDAVWGGGIGTTFSLTDPIDEADGKYWILSRGFAGPPAIPMGLYVTDDLATFLSSVTADPAALRVGDWPSANVPCDIEVAELPTGAQPYVLAGKCDFNSSDELWTFDPSLNDWRQVDVPATADGAGFSMFGVDPQNPQRLYAAVVGDGDPYIVRSDAGGATAADWAVDDELTELMHGRGAFVGQPLNANDGMAPLIQPTLIAFDPENPEIIIAGGRESGVFISSDAGESWAVLTDPFGTSSIPHLPRPFFAHFDHEAGKTRVYVGSVGRGVWRIELANSDLSVDKADTPDPVLAGSELTYTIQATNAGPDVALHPVMEDVLPAGTTFQSVQAPAGWSCETPAVGDEGILRCEAEEMAPGTVTFTIVVLVANPHGTTLSNLARIVSAAIDPDPTDNTSTETTGAFVPVAINIRPGGFPNTVNLKSTVTVAILTTNAGEYGLPLAFDATTIDPLSVRFGPASVLGSAGGALEIHGIGHLEDAYELNETTKDGDLDMILHFRAADAGLNPTSTEACVQGTFVADGTTYAFFGCDSISIVP